MLDHIAMDRVVLRKWLEAGYVEDGRWYPSRKGTPQGGIISPTLANMTLDGLERAVRDAVPRRSRVNFVRYADDFIITGNSKEWLEHEIMPVVVDFLKERGLQLSEEKTKVTHITEGVDFLGWNMRKYGGKLLIKPSKANIKAHLTKVRGIIKAKKTIKQVDLIGILNPVLRGWANYHRHSVAKDVFVRNDHEVWSMLWKWAKRRHPNKGLRWIMDKYFHTRGDRKWLFIAEEADRKGERQLFLEASMPIRRHVKIRTKANPHDPVWREYFNARKEQMKKATLLGCRVPKGALLEA